MTALQAQLTINGYNFNSCSAILILETADYVTTKTETTVSLCVGSGVLTFCAVRGERTKFTHSYNVAMPLL